MRQIDQELRKIFGKREDDNSSEKKSLLKKFSISSSFVVSFFLNTINVIILNLGQKEKLHSQFFSIYISFNGISMNLF